MSERIVAPNKSIVLAADVKPSRIAGLMDQVGEVEGLSAVKTGFELGYGLSLRKVVDTILEANEKLKVIHDHQKGATDIPEMGANFARAMRVARVDAAILFPFTGPKTQERWTKELQERGVTVIQGAEMTHDNIRASESGYILDGAFRRMFEKAVTLGVRNFVVPGNKPDAVQDYRSLFDEELGEGNYDLWAPGFLTQGGDVSETGQVAGPNWHAIIGSGIYKAESPRQAAIEFGQKILSLNTSEAA